MNPEQIWLLYEPNVFPEYYLLYVMKADEDKEKK